MKWSVRFGALLAFIVASVLAGEVELNQDPDHMQQCSGMYSRKSWGGSVDPFILAKFFQSTSENTDPVVSLVMFEWKDVDQIGRYPSDDSIQRTYICDADAVSANFCNETQIGEFVLGQNATTGATSSIITKAIHLNDPPAVNYPVRKTGYYCVWTYGYSAEDYRAIVEFRNAYGELPAAQIAKLPFYGGLTIVYAVIGAFWAFLYVQHRHDILPVQNYITAILVFLVIEMLMTWGYYDYQNRHGINVGTRVLMFLVAILNAGRNSFSLFLLLIVCMGYGVVKPSLGKTMWYTRILAITHFVFGVAYGIASLTIAPENAGPLVLLVVLPLAATMTAFYVWTLNSLNLTMKDLMERKQSIKAMMYRKLWWCILASILVIFGFFFVNSFSFAGRGDPDYVPDNWQTRWFILDGWLNLVYLVDLMFIAYLWRPTANNRRFAMSDEIAQDDEGFEIASFGGSLDEEGGQGSPENRTPSQDPGDISSVSKSQHPAGGLRESFDEDPVFAVGEDGDRWSDDETPRNSGERKRLTDKDD